MVWPSCSLWRLLLRSATATRSERLRRSSANVAPPRSGWYPSRWSLRTARASQRIADVGRERRRRIGHVPAEGYTASDASTNIDTVSLQVSSKAPSALLSTAKRSAYSPVSVGENGMPKTSP